MTMSKRSRVSSTNKPTIKRRSRMSSKENYCYKILNTYSLIADFKGRARTTNVPGPAANMDETFNEWKTRVLGDAVSDVVLYIPQRPAPQTRITTLQKKSDAKHIGNVFKAFEKQKNEKFIAEVKELKAVEKKKKELLTAKHKKRLNDTERSIIYVPKQILESLIQEHDGKIEYSVQDFLKRFLDETRDDINIEELLRKLLSNYNHVVRSYRELERKVSDRSPDPA